MVTEQEFISLCEKEGLIRISIAKIPTYTDVSRLEGLELTVNGIKSFWIVNSEKVYGNVPNNPIIAKIINSQRIEDKTDVGVYSTNGLMPESLTKALFDKWQNMPVPERLIMLQHTDQRYVEERPGRGGQKYKYVTGSYMIMCANMAFGFSWSSNVQQWERTDKEVICMGYIEAKINGELIRKYSIGQKDIAFKKDSKEVLCLGDDYKAAEMDMIKKALSFFGIAKDVYGGEV